MGKGTVVCGTALHCENIQNSSVWVYISVYASPSCTHTQVSKHRLKIPCKSFDRQRLLNARLVEPMETQTGHTNSITVIAPKDEEEEMSTTTT